MQRQILINVMIFFAYALNLPLNTQRPHHRSQRAGKLGLDFGSWQSPDISRSHLYRGTFPWTPPTAIYRAYTVLWWLQCISTWLTTVFHQALIWWDIDVCSWFIIISIVEIHYNTSSITHNNMPAWISLLQCLGTRGSSTSNPIGTCCLHVFWCIDNTLPKNWSQSLNITQSWHLIYALMGLLC